MHDSNERLGVQHEGGSLLPTQCLDLQLPPLNEICFRFHPYWLDGREYLPRNVHRLCSTRKVVVRDTDPTRRGEARTAQSNPSVRSSDPVGSDGK